MFKPKTLFVLGAGASSEFGFPTGGELTKTIADKLDRINQGSSTLKDDLIHTALLDYVGQQRPDGGPTFGINDFLLAASVISAAMPLAPSIDTFMDIHQNNSCIQVCGKMAIVQSIAEAENKSVKNFAASHKAGSRLTTDHEKIGKTWLDRFFKKLSEGVSKENISSIFDRISIISFNYDRSLEHYLSQAISTYYDVKDRYAEDIVAKLNIIHPYGTIAPWHEGTNHLPFGEGVIDRQHLLELAQRIHTYKEPPPDSMQMKVKVGEAQTIIFLGFGFLEDNMKLLKHPSMHQANWIYGTAFGLSASKREIIRSQLLNFLTKYGDPKMAFDRTILFEGKCAALFDEYFLS